MSTLVMKFGGSSVGNTTALTQVASIVLQERERWDELILVVSALEGVTDYLIEAAHLAQLSQRRGYRRIAATIRTRHLALVDQLPLGPNERTALQADIDQLLFDMLDFCQNIADSTAESSIAPDKTDAIIGVGERLAARIVAALLRQNNIRGVAIDATELIITDDNFGNATPDMPRTQAQVQEHLVPMLSRQIVPVITGFIARSVSGRPTTLGRGGSDLTTSLVSVCAKANEIWFWSDVSGMMSADPHELAEAQVINELSFDEVAELAYFGARILHARMIEPLKEHNIPLRIKNIFKPQEPGTLVHDTERGEAAGIKAVTSIQGIGLSSPTSGPLAEISTLVDDILLQSIGTHADVMISSQSSSRSFVCFVIPTSAGLDATHATLAALENELTSRAEFAMWRAQPVSIVTVIGAGLDRLSDHAATVLRILSGIRILALSQGPSSCSLSIVIQPEAAETTLGRIHDLIIGKLEG